MASDALSMAFLALSDADVPDSSLPHAVNEVARINAHTNEKSFLFISTTPNLGSRSHIHGRRASSRSEQASELRADSVAVLILILQATRDDIT